MIRCTTRKSVAILAAAAVGGLLVGTTVKPAAALSIAGVTPHAIALDSSAPATQPSGTNACSGAKNSCGPNGCQGK